MNQLPYRPLAALALAALCLTACTARQESKTPQGGASAAGQPVREGSAAPDFELKDADGRTVKLSDYKGKVILLNFWATWCAPCKIEIPWFVEFERAYRDKGFAVLGVSFDEDGWDVVKPYISANKVNYRVLLGDEKIDKVYGGAEGVSSLPTSYVIGRDGKIASVHIGLVPKKDYADDIQKLLQ